MHILTGNWCVAFSDMKALTFVVVKVIDSLFTEDYLPAKQKDEHYAKKNPTGLDFYALITNRVH